MSRRSRKVIDGQRDSILLSWLHKYGKQFLIRDMNHKEWGIKDVGGKQRNETVSNIYYHGSKQLNTAYLQRNELN